MFTGLIPLLHVADSAAAEDFYCQRLGFRHHLAYRPDPARADPCYLGLARDGLRLDLSSFFGDGVPGGVVGIQVTAVDALPAGDGRLRFVLPRFQPPGQRRRRQQPALHRPAAGRPSRLTR